MPDLSKRPSLLVEGWREQEDYDPEARRRCEFIFFYESPSGQVRSALKLQHPEYTEHTFLYLYSSWKNSTHRFSPYAKDVEYKKHTALFAPLLALVRTGVSLGDIATRLASDHPAYGFSAQAWEVHLGNYLRDLEPHHWTNTSHNRRMELVTIFKRDHDRSELKYVDVIADVSKKVGLRCWFGRAGLMDRLGNRAHMSTRFIGCGVSVN